MAGKMGQISARLSYAPNKQFKSDSARVAFSYALALVAKVVCGSIGIALLTP